ncbi:LysR family transcriptional regulator [Candidatus Lucifugimonas marina]|jgi:DNA-binding transcriptional LysR family regulator|uniref:LysR family transcriptional regulator n=1 Tax=Candidatus Lucifugimonas marina TaxID=3038979 RepID=A0AAJ6CSH0_9CHLR|nr:LysR family transcriptional regulator [SAR202 cluster bacterium JH702]MDG0870074.1 LysR family transcriptional regulator [SAR202 cluster bacterium JH639]WFG36363.1 LysR family transcriptional regulator [SAR202 cluster bacterium JH545]WFG40296.1 LysR family transcriptional regulator [SAR202 cluster bacterium JH1073]
MNIAELEALKAVAETGSFTRAADRLGMSQPGLSRQIQRLERELGTRLLERRGTGAILTDAGRESMQFAIRTISDFDALVSRFGPDPSALSGVIRIVASSTPAEYLVPALISEFTQQHTGISVEVLVADSAQVARTLGDRQADLGLSGMPSTSVGYSTIPMAKDEVVLAVSSSHRFADQRSITIDQLRDENIIEREGGSGTWQTVVQALSASGIELPEHKVSMTLGSTQAVVAAVQQNLGVGFVTQHAVSSHSKVVAVRIDGLSLERDLSLVYETGRVRGRHTQAFIDFVNAKSS